MGDRTHDLLHERQKVKSLQSYHLGHGSNSLFAMLNIILELPGFFKVAWNNSLAGIIIAQDPEKGVGTHWGVRTHDLLHEKQKVKSHSFSCTSINMWKTAVKCVGTHGGSNPCPLAWEATSQKSNILPYRPPIHTRFACFKYHTEIYDDILRGCILKAQGTPRRLPIQALTGPDVACFGDRTRTGAFNLLWLSAVGTF